MRIRLSVCLLNPTNSKEGTQIDVSTEEEWKAVLRLSELWSFNAVLDRAQIELKTFKNARDDKIVDFLVQDGRFPLTEAVKEFGQERAFNLALIHDRIFDNTEKDVV